MKTRKELKIEIDNKRKLALKVHKGEITRTKQEQRDNEISHLEGKDKALEEVLELIDKQIKYQEDVIDSSKGMDSVIEIAECSILVLKETKNEINGDKD